MLTTFFKMITSWTYADILEAASKDYSGSVREHIAATSITQLIHGKPNRFLTFVDKTLEDEAKQANTSALKSITNAEVVQLKENLYQITNKQAEHSLTHELTNAVDIVMDKMSTQQLYDAQPTDDAPALVVIALAVCKQMVYNPKVLQSTLNLFRDMDNTVVVELVNWDLPEPNDNEVIETTKEIENK